MSNEIEAVMDLVRSARSLVNGLSEKVAEVDERVKLLGSAVEMKLLDIDGRLLVSLDVQVLQANTAFRCAEDSVVEAEKQLARAASAEAESLVASMIQEPDAREDALGDIADSLGQARARVEEARAFAKLCQRRLTDLRLPRLTAS
jgi:hypothetical protein